MPVARFTRSSPPLHLKVPHCYPLQPTSENNLQAIPLRVSQRRLTRQICSLAPSSSISELDRLMSRALSATMRAGVTIPQAHPTGYPIYRLEWQSVGSLQRRLRNCMTAVRAEPYDYGSPELLRLELYLAWRARGMPMETPAVRP